MTDMHAEATTRRYVHFNRQNTELAEAKRELMVIFKRFETNIFCFEHTILLNVFLFLRTEFYKIFSAISQFQISY